MYSMAFSTITLIWLTTTATQCCGITLTDLCRNDNTVHELPTSTNYPLLCGNNSLVVSAMTEAVTAAAYIHTSKYQQCFKPTPTVPALSIVPSQLRHCGIQPRPSRFVVKQQQQQQDDGNDDITSTNNIANNKQETSSGNNDIEIWCNVIKVDLLGNEEPDGITKIRVLKSSVISDIKDAVKAKFPNKLQNVDADDLQVFPSNNTQTPLSIDEKWDLLFGGNTLKAPLIVKAPLYKSDPKAKERGMEFVHSIMKEYEDIQESDGMKVLKDVIILETGATRNIVLRNITENYWEQVIATVDCSSTTGFRVRACAIGTPGVGKTITTSILIRMLLKQKKKVIYHVRTKKEDGWVYLFIPNTSDADYDVHVILEKDFTVSKFNDPLFYYIVDPGKTKDDCSPSDTFQGKFILVSSPDNRHWGESEFKKNRDSAGRFLYFPSWSVNELISAIPFINEKINSDMVIDRYRDVGGIPRHIFVLEDDFDDILKAQDEAINDLTIEEVQKIFTGGMSLVETKAETQPRSAILAYNIPDDDNGTYLSKEVDIISDGVAMKISNKFMDGLWQSMLANPDGFDTRIYEEYCRHIVLKSVIPTNVTIVEGKRNKTQGDCEQLYFGGCTKIQLSMDVIDSAFETENIIFYPTQKNFPLIDFLFRRDNIYYAFQTTISDEHTASGKNVFEFVQNILGKYEPNIADASVKLIYMVCNKTIGDFATKPVNPNAAGKVYAISKIKDSFIAKNWDKLISIYKMPVYPPDHYTINKY